MISLNSASLQRGSKFLFEDASLTIHNGQKLGVVGRNGCGKSSLFACLQERLHLDQGTLSKPENLRIASMAQETGGTSRPAIEHVIDGDGCFRMLQSRLQQAEDREDQAAMARLHSELDRVDGYTVEHRAAKLLSGLGFDSVVFNNPVSSFSGGWRVRLNLASALMTPSDLLLLDEPTNHLDLEATLWLEQWLIGYPGTLMIISHDREFLDRVIRHVISFENGRLHLYRGNFSAYEKERAARMALQKSMFEKQQKRRAEIESFVRRFRAKASKAKQAQSRAKELQRMEEIVLAHVDSPFQFSFRRAEKMPEHLLSIQHLDIGFSDPLVKDINLSLRADSRIGLLGVNGSGKSTLLKVIGGELAPLAGELQASRHLKVGYFAQHQVDVLDGGSSALELLGRVDPDANEQTVRDYLGGFDFRGDQVDNSIDTLSGGEKVRLALAVIAWQKPNLLLLDEPTNHLDLEMRHALTVALQQFEGAIIVVSHDRHLLNNTVTEFHAISNGRLSLFDGDMADYQKQVQRDQSAPDECAVGEEDQAQLLDKRTQRQQAAARRQSLAPLKKEISTLEASMEKLSRKLNVIDEQLLDAGIYDDKNRTRLKELLLEQGSLKSQLEESEERWLELSEKYQEF
jgi:ATP-binding cassette subfamily F protein 3